MKRLLVLAAVFPCLAAGVGLARADADVTAPTFSTLALTSSSPASPGDTVVVSSDAADDSGVVTGTATFDGPAGHIKSLGWNAATNSFRGTVTNNDPSGTWTLRDILLSDPGNNYVNCWTAGAYCYDSTVGHTTPWTPINLSFDITGTNVDVTAPTFSTLALTSSSPASPGDAIVVSSDAADNSGVITGNATFAGPAGHIKSLGWNAATNSSRGTVSTSDPSGTWTLRDILLSDPTSNYISCVTAGAYCFDSTVGHTTPWTPINLSFAITGTNVDVTAPTFSTLALTSSSVSLGDTVVVSSDAADDSGVVTGNATFDGPAGHIKSLGWNAATNSFRGTVTNSDPSGTWTLRDILLSDPSNNYVNCWTAGAYCYDSTVGHTTPWTPTNLTFTVGPDTTPSTVSFDDPPAWTNGTPIAFTGSDPDDATAELTYQCQVDDETPTSCTSPFSPSGLSDGQHQLTVTASDAENNVGTPASITFGVDTSAPTASMTSPTTIFATSSTIQLGWTSGDDRSGVDNVDVRWASATYDGQIDGWNYPAEWQGLPTLPATATFEGATAGASYCFAVRAHDAAGNASDWSAPMCTSTPLDDTALSATAGWHHVTSQTSLYMGTGTWTSAVNETLSLTGVQIRRLAITAVRCPTCGTVGVYLNGTLLKSVNLQASSASVQRIAIANWSTLQTGTVTITTTSGAKRVIIDAVNLERY